MIRSSFIPLTLLASILLGISVSAKPKKAKPVEFSKALLEQTVWETPIESFKQKNPQLNFKWMSSSKQKLRSEGRNITTFGVPSGELLVNSKSGNVSSFTISYYNRGDNGNISENQFDKLHKQATAAISKATGTSAQDKSTKGAITLTKSFWKSKDTAYQLEKSLTKGRKADFLRLRVISLKSSRNSNSTANRSSLKGNVKRESNGDTYIPNVPMVDQGRKGYCACATAARIYNYYGRDDIDQHTVAKMAGSTAATGTQLHLMVNALKKVTDQLDSRVLVLYEYPKGLSSLPSRNSSTQEYLRAEKKLTSGLKEFTRDVNAYQQLAKKTDASKIVPFSGLKNGRVPSGSYVSYENMTFFRHKCDPLIYREIMMKKSSFGRFKSKIKEYINQGIPVGWCLQLGMFKEPGLPQAGGGHMRMIIGYNDKTDEIIYTDSWGAGHELKKMDAGNAFCMTTSTLVLPPLR